MDFGIDINREQKKYCLSFSKILDFISCLPFGEFTHAIRLARLARILKVLRLVSRANQYSGYGADLLRAAAVVGSTIFSGAYCFALLEPNYHFGDALWWSLVTVSTVGYGDIVPQTPEGRMLATPLIIVGIGVGGYIAGFMARVLTPDHHQEDEIRFKEMEDQLQALNHKVDTLLTYIEKSNHS